MILFLCDISERMILVNQIKDFRIYSATSPISKPIADSTHTISDISFLVVEIETVAGIKGQGYLLSFHYSPRAIRGALFDLRRFVLSHQYQVHETVKLKEDYEIETEYFGHDGVQKWAYATLNAAMWDAWGKTLNQPIWKLLGGSYKAIPIYGSGGWLSYSDEELLEEVLDYKKRGFKAVKIKVGSKKGVDHDLHRLKKCREALGDDVKIMMDANQGMSVADALALSIQAQSIGIQWFEEPVVHTDYKGYALLRSKTGIALAMGEREYNTEALKALIEKNALDMWQPDLIRIGGVDAWRDSAVLAIENNLAILPHYYKDYDVPLLCTIKHAYGAESFDWIDGIIDNPMVIENGYAYPRKGAGWGFSFKKEFLKEEKECEN